MLQKMKWLLSCCLVLALFAFACSGDGSSLGPDGTPTSEEPDNGAPDNGTPDNGTTEPAITLAVLSAEIFTPRCAVSGCHSGGFPAEGMLLTADRIAEQIIDVPSVGQPNTKRIDPGNPDGSYLLKKLLGRDIVGSQMPLNSPLLNDEQIGKIRAWIEAGAPVE